MTQAKSTRSIDMEDLSTVYESAQQPDQKFNNYLPNVTMDELLTPEPLWQPIHYPQYYLPQCQPMNPQPLPQIHSCYEAATASADNYYEKTSGLDGMYENLFGDEQQSCRNMSESDPNLQMNRCFTPQNVHSLEQQFEQERHQQFGKTPDVSGGEFPQQQGLQTLSYCDEGLFQGGVCENMKKGTSSGWSNLEVDNQTPMEAERSSGWSNLDLCENYEAGTAFADNYYERSSGLDGIYENLFSDEQQSCRNMSEYDPNLQMNQCFTPQNAFTLEQQFEQGRHQPFEETLDVNEGEFPLQQGFQTLSYCDKGLFQGGVGENMKKGTSSGWSNSETDNQTTMEAERSSGWSNLDLCENYEAGTDAFADNYYERSSGLDGIYENLFSDGQQSCRNMSEYDPNLQMNQCCTPQNASTLEQQFEQGRHQPFEETPDVNGGEFPQQQGFQTLSYCDEGLFQGGVYENMEKETSSEGSNLEKDQQTPMEAERSSGCSNLDLCENIVRHSTYFEDLKSILFEEKKQFKCEDVNVHRKISPEWSTIETDKQAPMMKANRLQCDLCKKTFSCAFSLKRHKPIHSTEKPVHECNLCTETFFTRSNLTFHNLIVHREEKQFLCEGCGKKFALKKKMQVHKRTRSAQRPFQCDLCKETFFYWCTLKKHEWTHTVKKRFQCDKCKKTFGRLFNLKIHRSVHTKEKSFQCNQCKKTYASQNVLNLHKRTIHKQERPFECDVCGIRTTRRTGLELHKQIHSEQKPFECDLCEETFSHWCTLKEHESTHTGYSLFQCDVCKETFTQEHRLEDHRRTHTGGNLFQCDICEKTFSRMQHLEYHRWAHSGQRPFQCKKCTDTFFNLSSLKKHERLHIGERPFQCDENDHLVDHVGTEIKEKPLSREKCEKKFSSRVNLKTYEHTHTREEPNECDSKNPQNISSEIGLEQHKQNLVYRDKNLFQCIYM